MLTKNQNLFDKSKKTRNYLQSIILDLQSFWIEHDCIFTPFNENLCCVDVNNFHASFLQAIGPEPWQSVFTGLAYDDLDQTELLIKIILKPTPKNLKKIFLKSFEALNLDITQFVMTSSKENWKSPISCTTGFSWSVYLDEFVISKFTFIQEIGDFKCSPVTCEISYNIENLAMILQKVKNKVDLLFGETRFGIIKYAEIKKFNKTYLSLTGNFSQVDFLYHSFTKYELDCQQFLFKEETILAFATLNKISKTFSLLENLKLLDENKKREYIKKIQKLTIMLIEIHFKKRKEMGFPLINKLLHNIQKTTDENKK